MLLTNNALYKDARSHFENVFDVSFVHSIKKLYDEVTDFSEISENHYVKLEDDITILRDIFQ